MIPLKDINPTHRFPAVNLILIGLNIGVFLYQVSLGDAVQQLFATYAAIPADIMASLRYPEKGIAPLGTLFSSMFMHGGWFHLGGNMLYLWVFGDNIEDKLGHFRYLLFYVASGLVATALHVAIDPTSTIPTVGASGAISGVLGGYLLLFPKARVLTLIPIFFFIQLTELPALVVLGLWFVIQFFNGLASLGVETAGMGGVAWWAHIGGFAAGLVLVLPMRRHT